MRALPAALLLAALPCAAWAQTYPLDKVTVVGNKQVPTATLYSVLTEKPGTSVAKDDILADQDNIVAAYKKANVGMSITVLLATKSNKHVEVTFKIAEKAATPPEVVKVDNKLAHMAFVGNVIETTDALAAAAALKPGDVVTNDSLQAAQKRILAVYQGDHKAQLANVNIEGDIATPTPGQVDVTWKITETKGKKKPRNTEDPGAQNMEP